ncbi:MAG: helix-turn-helix domain containing protein [Clostridiales bacterium]|nr:helix-turn-helix domain containing protein [Clostridiales bacterium]
MLHQALDMECSEAEIDQAYKAVYLLAFLCGLKERENEVERLKKERDKAKAEAKEWRGVAVVREDNAAELDYVKGQLEETRAALSAAQNKVRQYSKELEAWKPQEAEGSTEAQIIAYYRAGHSYQETADRFGTNKTRVYRLVKQAAALVEDGASGEE